MILQLFRKKPATNLIQVAYRFKIFDEDHSASLVFNGAARTSNLICGRHGCTINT